MEANAPPDASPPTGRESETPKESPCRWASLSSQSTLRDDYDRDDDVVFLGSSSQALPPDKEGQARRRKRSSSALCEKSPFAKPWKRQKAQSTSVCSLVVEVTNEEQAKGLSPTLKTPPPTSPVLPSAPMLSAPTLPPSDFHVAFWGEKDGKPMFGPRHPGSACKPCLLRARITQPVTHSTASDTRRAKEDESGVPCKQEAPAVATRERAEGATALESHGGGSKAVMEAATLLLTLKDASS